MKMNNRFIYGFLSLILAAIVAFIAIPAVTSKTSHTTQIVRIKSDVARGSILTSDDVELVEVGGYNLPEGLAKKISDVTDTYASTAAGRNYGAVGNGNQSHLCAGRGNSNSCGAGAGNGTCGNNRRRAGRRDGIRW